MARRLGGDARHFRPDAIEKRTLRRFRSTLSRFHLCFENFQTRKIEPVPKFPKLYNNSFSLGKFNCEFIFLLKRLEK